jgi:hypothetical protein
VLIFVVSETNELKAILMYEFDIPPKTVSETNELKETLFLRYVIF